MSLTKSGGYRGSVNRGDDNPQAKLSNSGAEAARRDYLSGVYTAERLAKKYRVSPSSMKRLLLGESFKDAGGPRFAKLVYFQEWAWGIRPAEREVKSHP
jgi:hypothetical protein